MLRTEIFVLVAQLAPNTSILRRTQHANSVFKLSPEQLHSARRLHRYLVSSGIQYPMFRHYVSGMMDGLYTYFRGKCCLVRVYNVCGRKHGFGLEWDWDGHLIQQTAYRHDKRHGALVRWYSNGQIAQHTVYVDGKRHGEHVRWYSNGQIRKRVRYDNDVLQECIERWNRDGTII